ncbi:MAG: adenosine-specific kinase [Candidatus Parvarchaeota archaeon]|nr:adenosine-specific kinase [Candidatus Parvarchaeota archaeon]MCW1294731.1 adenosine-specific kinase [Candidatus Parvarchaeum tengchongense]MCW1295099.1 adenosine-specific kinase [Candidatus Parvarchaeum tengchongense]MCW1312320.1 adenosine-specific kinase [Candidatus Parvarchaeum tengchongense]
MSSKIEEVKLDFDGLNIIVGQSHFIKTVEDVYEALITSFPGIKFGLAFNEASGDRLIRSDGNDEELIKKSIEFAEKIGAGHSFVVLLKNAYPINVLNRLKQVMEIVNIYAATANPLKVIVYDDGMEGRGIIGVIDGKKPLGIEKDEDKKKRHDFLRDIGYKR